MRPDAPLVVHATTVNIGGQGIVILGASGTGKSNLALHLISLGAVLVADDRTELWRDADCVMADCPPAITGLIEARGIGLLPVPVAGATPVGLVIDLDREEPDRLPHLHHHSLLGQQLPCLWRAPASHFPAAVLLWVKAHLLSGQ